MKSHNAGNPHKKDSSWELKAGILKIGASRRAVRSQKHGKLNFATRSPDLRLAVSDLSDRASMFACEIAARIYENASTSERNVQNHQRRTGNHNLREFV